MENYNGSEKYRPLSPWAYFGYSVLYTIPIVGFIMLIIYSFNDSNIHRRNHARSFWCIYAIYAVIIIMVSVTGGLATLTESI